MQKAQACSQAPAQATAAPPETTAPAGAGTADAAIAFEARHHDVTFAHVIDVRMADSRGAKALRVVPMLPGLDLKNGKTTAR